MTANELPARPFLQGRDGYFRGTGFRGNFRRDSGNAHKFDRDSGFKLLNGKVVFKLAEDEIVSAFYRKLVKFSCFVHPSSLFVDRVQSKLQIWHVSMLK